MNIAISRPRSHAISKSSFALVFLLVLVVFAPIVRIGGLPIPTIIPASALLVVAKKIYFGPRFLFVASLGSAGYLLFVALINRPYNPLLQIKDLLYFLIPIQFFLGFTLFYSIFRVRPRLSSVFIQFAASFLLLQLFAVACELLRLNVFMVVLSPYIKWFLLNTSSTAAQLAFISLRPSGTVGNPVILGLLSYILGRLISYAQGKPTFYIIGLILVLLTASRSAMAAIILAECVAYAVRPISKLSLSKKQFQWLLASLIIIPAAVVVMFAVIPFMHAYLTIIASGNLNALSGDYSVAYRAQTISWALSQPHRLLFGGLSLAEAPASIDSEVFMRSLQLGVMGYIALQIPVLSMIGLGIRRQSLELTKYAVGLYVFCIVCSVTFSSFSDPYFIIWYSLIAAYWASATFSAPNPAPATTMQ